MIRKTLLALLFLVCIWIGNICAISDISYTIDELDHSLGVDELESVDWVGVIIIAKMGCDVYLDTSPFDVNLSSADTNVQKAFETLDGLVAVSTATYSHTSSTATYSLTSGTATYAESVNYNVLVSSADYAPGDNLGNHTATQNLDLTGFGIINIGGLHGNSSLNIDSAGILYLGPNNNSGLYWFSSVTGDALFGIGGVNESTFRLTKPLNLQASGNVNDYIQFKTVSNIPEITTIGDCNLKITASGGTIDFDDENLTTTGTGTFGDLVVDETTLVVDAVNNKVGIGTASPNAPLEVKGAKPSGNVGGFQSGMFHVTGSGTAEFSNSVITGHSAYNTNTQLWYLGSISSGNDNIGFHNRQNGGIYFYTNNTFRMVIDANGNVGIGTASPNSKLEVNGTIHSDYGISATTGVFSGQVTSNGNKLIDVYDWAVVITTPTWLGTDAVLVSPIRSFAVTITTITMITTGGTNFIGMIEQRAYASPHNAGTDIWTGDVTISSTTWTTGTPSDYTVPANYGLYLVPTSVSGPVKILTLRGIVSKD